MKKKSDIPFSSDSSKFFIPWLNMFMVFIATLMLAIGIVTYTSIQSWSKTISGSLTVQIPTYTQAGEPRNEDVEKDIERALTLLRSSDGITGASILSDTQMNELMTPWLGKSDSLTELPLPKIIDVSVDTQKLPDFSQLKKELNLQVPSASIDSHRIALAELLSFFDNTIHLMALVLILILITTTFSTVYITKSSLSVHQKVIELIHMMGASDFYITIQYATRCLKLTLIGSIAGFILALPLMALFGYFLSQMRGSFILSTSFTLTQWLLLISIPVFTTLLAFITAYKTVSKHLKQTL